LGNLTGRFRLAVDARCDQRIFCCLDTQSKSRFGSSRHALDNSQLRNSLGITIERFDCVAWPHLPPIEFFVMHASGTECVAILFFFDMESANSLNGFL
jgi:hypothetical protein